MIAPQTEIIVTQDGLEIARRTVIPGDYVIGRDSDCDVPLDIDLISRKHARLIVNYDHALLEDLESSNGTRVNGKPVNGITRLWPNQKIEIGLATIELRRIRDASTDDLSLAPQSAIVRDVLPEEFLRDKKYDIGGVVAQGGMGAILDAREATTGRTVAMKVMLESNSAEHVMRFVAEAKVTAQLEHPNIVPVHELSVDENDQVYYTMKFVRGITLREVLDQLRDGDKTALVKYPLATLLTVFQKVCDALAFAHSKGVIHRDLKPANLMLGDYGEVLVMDWGLAKTEAQDRRSEDAQTFDLSPLVTLDGKVMGTPKYMSPEQARGEAASIDALTDIYALGAILYHILALRPPVSGENAMEVIEKVGRGMVTPLLQAFAEHHQRPIHLPGGHVPESLDAVVRKAMAFDPDERYPQVEALQADISAYQNGFATKAEKAGIAKLLLLFLKRHKAVSIAVIASLLLLVGVSTAFTLRVFHERNLAVAERNRALKSQAEAETERNRAQTAQTEAVKAQAAAETERNRAENALSDAEKARAEAETERNRAQKALADFEAERTRADTEHSTAETQRARAEGESGRAEMALTNLKQTAPTYFSLAKSRFAEEKFNDALEQIGYALQLDGANPDYHLFRANVFQVTKKLPEAIAEYRRTLDLRPGDSVAKSNMAVCERLAKENRGNDARSMLGLISWWKADGDALDSAGVNHGKLMNGATFGPGRNGKAFQFNGSSAYISIPRSPDWAFGNNDFTIALWVTFSEIFGEQAFLASDEGVGRFAKWIFQFVPGHLQFKMGDEKKAGMSSSYFGPPVGQWCHIAVVRAGNSFHFYANGAEISSGNWVGSVPTTKAPLTLGHSEGRFFFSGLMDDIRVYNRSLSSPEIKALSAP